MPKKVYFGAQKFHKYVKWMICKFGPSNSDFLAFDLSF